MHNFKGVLSREKDREGKRERGRRKERGRGREREWREGEKERGREGERENISTAIVFQRYLSIFILINLFNFGFFLGQARWL